MQLPRFLLERSYSLRDVLQTLNITQVFQEEADLSNMGEGEAVKLTQVSLWGEGGAVKLTGCFSMRVHLLGSTCLPSVLLQKRVKNTSWHSENKEWNRLASVQVCVI